MQQEYLYVEVPLQRAFSLYYFECAVRIICYHAKINNLLLM